MNDAQLLVLVAETDAYAAHTPLPESMLSREAALHEIERRTGMDTRDTATRRTRPDVANGREPAIGPETPGPVEKPRPNWRRSGVRVGAAAFGLVIVIGAVIAAVNTIGDSPDVATTTTPPPTTATTVTEAPTFTTDEALAVAEEYLAAFEAADIDAIRGLFGPDAHITEGGPAQSVENGLKYIELVTAWDRGQETVYTDLDCQARHRAGGRLMVTCYYGNYAYLFRAVGAPPAPMTTLLIFDDEGLIDELWYTSPPFGRQEYYGDPFRHHDDYVTLFSIWLSRYHPDDVVAANRDPDFLSDAAEAAEAGAIDAAYADEYAAYLEANGCVYDEPCNPN